MARPPEQPVKKEGRWTYKVFMGEGYAWPAECATEKDIEVMNVINAACKKDGEVWISDSQHRSLMRLLQYQAVSSRQGWR